VVVAEQRFGLGRSHQLLQEQPHDVVSKEPITALVPPARSASGLGKGEYGRMPDRIVGAQAHEPAEHQVVMELLQQEPFRADAVERL
jgi:hypothetical protein